MSEEEQTSPEEADYLNLDECTCEYPEIVEHRMTGAKICVNCNPFYNKTCGRCGSKRYRCCC